MLLLDFRPTYFGRHGRDQTGEMVEFAAGRRWRGWVDAYREDFIARGETKLTMAFDRPDHICRLDQERLLHGALAGGGPEVSEHVSASLCKWALSNGRSYTAGLRAGPSISGRAASTSLV